MKNEFGKFLKEYMLNHEYKLEAFAVKVGYSFGLISHYVTGRRSPSYKFINDFFTKFDLTEEEKLKILDILKEDKLPEEINKLEKKFTNYSSDIKNSSLIPELEKELEKILKMMFFYLNDKKISNENKLNLLKKIKTILLK
ncbi:helix-turn-helix domain-containing protein [Fusobacterium varium]|jgi:transcriptional regulator with XRE-family HTH domain